MAKTKDKVIIFDTTLRDGEQAAGGTLNAQEKLVPENLDWNMSLPIVPMATPGRTKVA